MPHPYPELADTLLEAISCPRESNQLTVRYSLPAEIYPEADAKTCCADGGQ